MSEPRANRIFHHYKGGLYFVHKVSVDADTGEHVVDYQHLHSGATYTRKVSGWTEPLESSDQERFLDVTRHLPELIQTGLANSRVGMLRKRADLACEHYSDPKLQNSK